MAECLREWFPKVLPGTVPWVSSVDITKGTPWFGAISEKLASTPVIVLCVTSGNVKSPWMLFEAGAVAMYAHARGARVCPLLIDIGPAELKDGPLGQFQCTVFEKKDFRLLVRDLNKRLEPGRDESLVSATFDRHWNSLKKQVDRLLRPDPGLKGAASGSHSTAGRAL